MEHKKNLISGALCFLCTTFGYKKFFCLNHFHGDKKQKILYYFVTFGLVQISSRFTLPWIHKFHNYLKHANLLNDPQFISILYNESRINGILKHTLLLNCVRKSFRTQNPCLLHHHHHHHHHHRHNEVPF